MTSVEKMFNYIVATLLFVGSAGIIGMSAYGTIVDLEAGHPWSAMIPAHIIIAMVVSLAIGCAGICINQARNTP